MQLQRMLMRPRGNKVAWMYPILKSPFPFACEFTKVLGTENVVGREQLQVCGGRFTSSSIVKEHGLHGCRSGTDRLGVHGDSPLRRA